MSAFNYRSGAPIVNGVVTVASAAGATEGVPIIEGGWAGIPASTAITSQVYMLHVKGEFELVQKGGETWNQGDLLYITSGNVVTKTLSANRLFGRVTAVPGAASAARPLNDIPTGSTWVELMQAVQVTTS